MSLTFNMVSGNYGDMPTPTEKTVSGAVVYITDALRKPAVALSTAINPVQDLHGYDSPWPAGGGTNKFDKDHTINSTHTSSIATALSTYISTGQYATGYTTNATSITANAQYCTTFTPCTSGTTYTIKNLTSGGNLALIGFVDDSGTVVSHNSSWSNQAWTHTADSTEKYIMICAKVAELENVMIVEGSTMPASPSPYANICPISGFSAANIVVSPTTTAGDGTTYTVQFGAAGTVYGGTLDVVNGTLTIDHQMFLFDGSDTSNWTVNANNYFQRRRPTGFSETTSESWPKNFYSNALETTTRSGSAGNIQFNSFYAWSTYLAVRIDSFNHDLTTFQNFLTNTGLQILVPIEEETVQLTPTEVQMLLGTNNVWSDTNGDVTLTYMGRGN